MFIPATQKRALTTPLPLISIMPSMFLFSLAIFRDFVNFSFRFFVTHLFHSSVLVASGPTRHLVPVRASVLHLHVVALHLHAPSLLRVGSIGPSASTSDADVYARRDSETERLANFNQV
jgi:hypothetical protein